MSVIKVVDHCVHDAEMNVENAGKAVYRAICTMPEEQFVREFSQCVLHSDGGACVLFGMNKFPCMDMPEMRFPK